MGRRMGCRDGGRVVVGSWVESGIGGEVEGVVMGVLRDAALD